MKLEKILGFEVLSESKMAKMFGGILTATGKGGYPKTYGHCSRTWTTDEHNSETNTNRGVTGTEGDCISVTQNSSTVFS